MVDRMNFKGCIVATPLWFCGDAVEIAHGQSRGVRASVRVSDPT
jgi:hypothetical protein